MRRIFPTLLMVFSVPSFAGRLSAEKAEAFFKKERPCAIAIAPVYPKRHTVSGEPNSRAVMANNTANMMQQLTHAAEGDIYIPSGSADGDVDIICVFEGTKYAHTVNEIHGCFAGYYNPASGDYKSILSKKVGYDAVMEGKKCTKDVVAELLTSKKLADEMAKKTAARQMVGNFNTIFEFFLVAANVLFHPELKVLYDEYGLASSICPKQPCGPILNVEEQVSAIQPDPKWATQVKAQQQKQSESDAVQKKKKDDQKQKAEKLWE